MKGVVKMVSAQEVRKHNTRESCWVIIHGSVYDLSDFLDKHPGGAASILRYAGQVGLKGGIAYQTADGD